MLNVKGMENSHLDDFKWGHLAMTYTGIAILIALGDDLSRLNKKAIIEGKLNLWILYKNYILT